MDANLSAYFHMQSALTGWALAAVAQLKLRELLATTADWGLQAAICSPGVKNQVIE